MLGDTFTDLERQALTDGLARVYRGRVIPIIRGAEGDDPPADPAAPPADPPADPTRTFSQDDVDRIVRDRLARAKTTPPADYDDLKAAKARLDQIEEANKTELDKERDRATAAEQRAQELEQTSRETLLRSAVISEAAKKNVVDPEAAVALLDRSTLTLDDAGLPTNVGEAVDLLLKAKPYLAGGGERGSSADQGARGGGDKTITRDQLKTMSSAEIAEAHDKGQLDHLMQGDS